ncbi:MAG: hypothetical protein RR461_04650 [Angelakisella sp.]
MKHAALFKKILAFILAALIGLSALSGLIMAFAAEKKFDYEYELEATEDDVVYVEQDDFALVVPADNVTHLRLEFEDVATFSVAPTSGEALWVGFSTEYTDTVENLEVQYGVSFDVLDFTFSPTFAHKGSMTITTQNPYLYRLDGKTLTPVATTYTDGVHTFETDTLGCFLASNGEITL